MEVEWDPAKARLNARKHGVAFADAVAALKDVEALTMRDALSDDEERWVTLGLDAFGRVLVVVYTWRGERVRLISVRRATPRERRRYEESDEA
ncbi:MAG: BrnT family toxin [Bryobacteraceae bacterium]